ncbi:MAG: serine/threonine protein kinase, partial [Polyangiaceae bacterium]
FMATHMQLDEKVAIKFLRTEFTGPHSGELAGRFLKEARTSSKIKSEHVVRVHDVGASDTGTPYIVMEFLTGQDLDQVVSQHGVLPISQAVDYVLQACEALAEAHNIGIVHRDLKPANLFLMHRADGSACVKVLDFGISKFKDTTAPDMGMTKTHAVMGSPRYMSPEQMRSSKDVDARADIWAIGIILYELFAGTVPFNGESMPQICAAIIEETPKNIRLLRPEITAELDAIISKCLAKKADARYANVAHLARALAAFGSSEARASADRIGRVLRVSGRDVTADTSPRDFTVPFSSRPSMPSASESSPGRSVSEASATAVAWTGIDTGGPQTKRRRRTILAVAAFLAIFGIAGVFFITRHHPTTSVATAVQADTRPHPVSEQPAPPAVPDAIPLPATSSVVATTPSATSQ